ncbi:fluoride efflux transporter CrcB [Desertibacillus haloalkaliphilus]|uniref:fluoride efflux transporter CrcB n=1 Tax=Desertibacillus haloalkaliphilus TaxID=1328930 RepID=UPI001C27EFCC|nr:fluoride efflux transporter CrcB [Desertibacillus haloalkaliphilus]MBU8906667.1 fluoride efflux transporter CrcB [Desertibacillus haloalkaliphilus]
MNILLLALGGSLGAVARYLLGLLFMKTFPKPPIPIAMLIVNLIGSLGLGLFFGLYFADIPLGAYDDSLYLFLGIGFFGAFTTFSTFSTEAMQLLRDKKTKGFVLYSMISIIGSIFVFAVAFMISALMVS